MKYTTPVQLRISDFGYDGKMTPASLLKILEETANMHSFSVNDRSADREAYGTSWILTEWRAIIDAPIRYRDELTAVTWICSGSPSGRLERHFILKDKAEKTLVRAIAQVVLFNVNENRLIRLDDELMRKIYDPETDSVFETRIPRLIAPKVYDSETEFTVRKADIDTNVHVHNTNYMDFISEVLDGNEFGAFRITYLRPIKYGDKITIKCTHTDGRTVAGLYRGTDLCSVIEITEK